MFKNLNSTARKSHRPQRPENLTIRVTGYDIKPDQPSFVTGIKVAPGAPDDGTAVRVRMMTIQEGAAAYMAMNRNANPEAVANQIRTLYTGSGVKTRPSIKDLVNGSKLSTIEGGVVQFDRAQVAGKNADGSTDYKAHWLNVIARTPDVPVMVGQLSFLKTAEFNQSGANGEQSKKFTGYAETVNTAGAVVLNQSNVLDTIKSVMHGEYEGGVARRPSALLRVIDNETKLPVTVQRLDTGFDIKEEVDYDTGEKHRKAVAWSGEKFLDQLIDGREYPADANPAKVAETNLIDDILRVTVAKLTGTEPKLSEHSKSNPAMMAELEGFGEAIASGSHSVEIIPVDRFIFGPAYRESLHQDHGKRVAKAAELAAQQSQQTGQQIQPKVIPFPFANFTNVERSPEGSVFTPRLALANIQLGVARNNELQVYKATTFDAFPRFVTFDRIKTPVTSEALTALEQAEAAERRAAYNRDQPPPHAQPQQQAQPQQEQTAQPQPPQEQPTQPPRTPQQPQEQLFDDGAINLSDFDADMDLDLALANAGQSLNNEYDQI